MMVKAKRTRELNEARTHTHTHSHLHGHNYSREKPPKPSNNFEHFTFCWWLSVWSDCFGGQRFGQWGSNFISMTITKKVSAVQIKAHRCTHTTHAHTHPQNTTSKKPNKKKKDEIFGRKINPPLRGLSPKKCWKRKKSRWKKKWGKTDKQNKYVSYATYYGLTFVPFSHISIGQYEWPQMELHRLEA